MFLKFSKLPSSLRDQGNFVKTLKILVKLILNCPRAYAITYTYIKNTLLRLVFSTFRSCSLGVMFLNARRVLSQCNTRLRLLYLRSITRKCDYVFMKLLRNQFRILHFKAVYTAEKSGTDRVTQFFLVRMSLAKSLRKLT